MTLRCEVGLNEESKYTVEYECPDMYLPTIHPDKNQIIVKTNEEITQSSYG